MPRQKDPPGTATECRSCKQMIVWTRTEKGKNMPCDVGPSDEGTFFLFRRSEFIEAIHVQSNHASAVKARERNDKRYNSHFSTCPQADKHRKD